MSPGSIARSTLTERIKQAINQKKIRPNNKNEVNLHERNEVKQYACYTRLIERIPLVLGGDLGLYRHQLVMPESIHHTVREVITQFGADILPPP